jgi:hypothetical protein
MNGELARSSRMSASNSSSLSNGLGPRFEGCVE